MPKWLPAPLARRWADSPGLAQALGNLGWLFFDKIFRMGVGLVVGLWLARYLGPEDFGQLSYATTFVGLFYPLAELGLASIVVREVVRQKQSAPGILATAFLMQAAGAALALSLILITANFLLQGSDQTRLMIGVLSFCVVCRATEVVRYWFESQVKSRYVVWVENGVFALMAVVRVILIMKQAELMAFVWVCLVEAALVGLGFLAMFWVKGGGFLLLRPSVTQAVILLRECWPLLLAGIAVSLYIRIDVVMLQHMANSKQVGIYAAATRISELFYLLPSVVVASFSPMLIKCFDENHEKFTHKMVRIYWLLAWYSIAFSVLVSFFSDSLVALLFGQKYEGAAEVLAVHVWALLPVSLGIASSQYLLVHGKQKMSLVRTGFGLLLNIILNILLIPRYGAMGAAIATVASYALATYSLVFFKETRREGGLLISAPLAGFCK